MFKKILLISCLTLFSTSHISFPMNQGDECGDCMHKACLGTCGFLGILCIYAAGTNYHCITGRTPGCIIRYKTVPPTPTEISNSKKD